jgi:hypothetical protein
MFLFAYDGICALFNRLWNSSIEDAFRTHYEPLRGRWMQAITREMRHCRVTHTPSYSLLLFSHRTVTVMLSVLPRLRVSATMISATFFFKRDLNIKGVALLSCWVYSSVMEPRSVRAYNLETEIRAKQKAETHQTR